ncbi:MAG: hypothetical protein AAF889_04460 [Cyanobacteria bacterium P01_D01_bin.73]
MATRSDASFDTAFRPLGAYFVEAGLISPAQVQVVLNDQAMTGLRFGEILVQRGWMKETTIEYFVDKLIEPERRSLQKSMSWQKGSTNKKPSHRKGFVTGPPAAPPSNRKPNAVGTIVDRPPSKALRPVASQHRKGFVSGQKPDANVSQPPAAQTKDTDQTELTTCSGLSKKSDYDEAAESLVWIG